ncbi:MAG: hypothetical protein GC168_16060 [Candidatus Hydrogenedens sp.]|nr:hypothetical protein [Candidatus Hydrogenedens sp.]
MDQLNLAGRLRLAFTRRGLCAYDSRPLAQCPERAYLLAPHPERPHDAEAQYPLVLELIAAHAREDGGEVSEVVEVEPVKPHAAYGGDVIEATASFSDGTREQWLVRWDARSLAFEWVRQPLGPPRPCRFEFALPMQPGGGEFVTCSQGHAASDGFDSLQLPKEQALLFHTADIRGGLFLHLGMGGALDLYAGPPPEQSQAPMPLPHAAASQAERCWRGTWVPPVSRMVRLTVTPGTPAAVRAAAELPGLSGFSDASLDFGAFYSHAAAYALFDLTQVPALPLDAGTLRNIVLAAEFCYLLAPEPVRNRLLAAVEACTAREPQESAYDTALILVALGRLHAIGGADESIEARLDWMRAAGRFLLSLRLEGEALPVTRSPELPHLLTKEPAFCALARLGLARLANVLRHFGDHAALEFDDAAAAMRWAAIAPVESEGLWTPSSKHFVHALVYAGLEDAAPGRPRVLSAYRHEQNMMALWLGLYPEEYWAHAVLEQIDYRYTHALGRGDCEIPPEGGRSFPALLEAYVRHKLRRPHAHRLLQRVLGTTRGLAPFPREWARRGTERDPLAPAPYFGLVLQAHYGLDYSRDGWHVGTPHPLENYPLTRVTGLRHRFATINITWQGRGRVQRILVNGATIPHVDAPIGPEKGEHEVTVILG